MAAPGGAHLFLSEPGEYIIFYENNSFPNDKLYSTSEQIPGMEIRVREEATDSELATYSTKSSLTYSLGSRSGRSIMAFTAQRAQHLSEMVEGIFSSIMISLSALFSSIATAAAMFSPTQF